MLNQEKKLLTEPQLLPLLKDHFLTIMSITELAPLVEVHHQFHQLFHLEDVMPKLIQSFQDHQELFQFQTLDTPLLQDTVLFMDHVHLSLTVLLEISSDIMVILSMELLMLLELKEYYSADLFDYLFIFLTSIIIFFLLLWFKCKWIKLYQTVNKSWKNIIIFYGSTTFIISFLKILICLEVKLS